jgi:hypothetical protein
LRDADGDLPWAQAQGSRQRAFDGGVGGASERSGSDGIIHVIDSVLVPPSGVAALPGTGDASSPVPLLAAALGALLLGLAALAGRARPHGLAGRGEPASAASKPRDVSKPRERRELQLEEDAVAVEDHGVVS